MQNPANAGRRQGSMQNASLAAGNRIDTLKIAPSQQNFVVLRLVRRFGMPIATASAVAAANAWGQH